MTAPAPYLHLPGTAREALTRYRDIFGGDLSLNTYGDFGRSDGPADAIAHGMLTGAVSLFAADIAPGETAFAAEGLMLSLLGHVPSASTLRRWFADLAIGGEVVDDLAERPWGAWDGMVRDAYGVTWLIGFEVDEG